MAPSEGLVQEVNPGSALRNETVLVTVPILALFALVALGIVIYALAVISRNVEPQDEPLAREQEGDPFMRIPPPY